MTSADILHDVLGDLDEHYIQEIDKRISFVKKRKVISFVSMAAVFVIMCTSIVPLFGLIPKSADAEASSSSNVNTYTQDSLTPPESNDIDINGNSTFGGLSAQESQFLYYIDADGNIACLDRETNQATILLEDNNYTDYDIYSDDEYVYLVSNSVGSSDVKNSETPVCYKIVKDSNGKPYELNLVDYNTIE
ncbi:MAG: hypothetical protein IJ433_04475 [Ruminococcus sp.]|nr:hypothetical protein [Ruminococcus sp.]